MSTDLDAQVAVEIIGWTAPPNKLPSGKWRKMPGWETNPYSGEQEATFTMLHRASGQTAPLAEWQIDKWWRAPDGSYHEHLPAYSSDWAAFGALWEYLQADPDIDVMKVFYVGDDHEAGVNDSFGYGTFHEAFCHAALAAVREEKAERADEQEGKSDGK